jgi:hypothetical protein
LGSFGNGSSHNGREGAGKSELEEPTLQFNFPVGKEKSTASDERRRVKRSIIATVRESIANRPKSGAKKHARRSEFVLQVENIPRTTRILVSLTLSLLHTNQASSKG